MTMNRRIALIAGACAALSGTILHPVRSYADASTIPVVGRMVRWVSVLPKDGWIGGNVDEIKAVLASMQAKNDKNAPVGLVKNMAIIAEDRDVFLVNVRDGLTKSDTITTLTVKVVDKAGDYSNAQYGSDLAKELAKSVRGATGARSESAEVPDAKVEFVKVTTVGGRPSLSIGLHANLKNGSAFYDVYQLVALSDGRGHVFELTVDSDHFTERFNDLGRMMQAVRYLN